MSKSMMHCVVLDHCQYPSRNVVIPCELIGTITHAMTMLVMTKTYSSCKLYHCSTN